MPFLSTYCNKLDKKRRVSVPILFRSELADQTFNGLIAFCSYKLSCIEVVPSKIVDDISAKVDVLDSLSSENTGLISDIFADSHMLQFDGDGRITLIKTLCDHAKLSSSVLFVGRGPTFQIWDEYVYAEYRNRVKQASI